ncbi:MAG: hypothetical protein RLZZ618_1226 [Pseudomonadota bacterium]|jgi:uncharacterized RDD family membrane protein YckC
MQQENPYAPTAVSLSERDHAGTSVASHGELVYAGFWRRFGAFWIDALIFLPVMAIAYILSEKTRFFYAYWFIPSLALGLFFHVYLVTRFGGTPGKLALNTRIALVDGSAVTAKAAFIRHAVQFVLSTLTSVALVLGSMAMTDDRYFSLGYVARVQEITANAPFWYATVTLLTQLWIWSEFVSMLFNKKRRAIHDFMAGTVVVRK